MVDCGAAVALNARDSDQAESTARGISADVLAVAGDVSDAEAVRAMVKRTVDRFGRIDILVNNAAVLHATQLLEISEAEWRRTLDVNLTGAFLTIQTVAPMMKANGFGRIVNISSSAGRSVGTLGGAHYTASKAGLLGLTRAAARELGPYGITVNAVCPGLTDTELVHSVATTERLEAIRLSTPTLRVGQADDVASMVCYLASDAAAQVTGASIDINGGSLMV
jgi:3-oxoacyl-[acyl-carrier protein] reductase